MRLSSRPVADRSTRSLRSLAPGRPRAAAHDPACWRSLRSRGSCALSAALWPTARLGRYAPSLPAGRGRRRMTGVPDELDRLWTPHRMAYITDADRRDEGYGQPAGCPFCRAPKLGDEESL